MAVRVKIRIKVLSTGKEVETIALVNSGYETYTPQILVPDKLAELLGVWPRIPNQAITHEYGTAGGFVRKYVIPNYVSVRVVEPDIETSEVIADLVISEIVSEVLISDKLTSKLGIVLEDVGEGLWILKSDPNRKIRRSYSPRLWK